MSVDVVTLPMAVSELGWWTRRVGYRDHFLKAVVALRRGPDEWVLHNGFRCFLTRAKEWGPGVRGKPKTRWSTAEVFAIAPGLVVRDTLAQWPQIPADELVVFEGFLPDD